MNIKAIETLKANKKKRNSRVIARFNYLYHQERKRWDDSVKEVCDEWGISYRTFERIMKSQEK